MTVLLHLINPFMFFNSHSVIMLPLVIYKKKSFVRMLSKDYNSTFFINAAGSKLSQCIKRGTHFLMIYFIKEKKRVTLYWHHMSTDYSVN